MPGRGDCARQVRLSLNQVHHQIRSPAIGEHDVAENDVEVIIGNNGLCYPTHGSQAREPQPRLANMCRDSAVMHFPTS